ncbi:MAG: hypothetical protein WD766_04945 [Gemmatimonadota bacterium]
MTSKSGRYASGHVGTTVVDCPYEPRCRSSASRGAAFLMIAVFGVAGVSGGCAAAVGAAMAAGDIRQGIAGLQQLVSGVRAVPEAQLTLTNELSSPLAGTYRGFQALGDDTVRFHVRTTEQPTATIVDARGNVTGYMLPGIAAVTLDSLEARVHLWTSGEAEEVPGRAMFFVEGTQPAEPNARTLYPAAFLGRVAAGESAEADRQLEELEAQDLDMSAPEFRDLSGQGIPHELFDTVAEAVFTLGQDGSANYHQEYRLDDGRVLVLHFERISPTTLPAGG